MNLLFCIAGARAQTHQHIDSIPRNFYGFDQHSLENVKCKPLIENGLTQLKLNNENEARHHLKAALECDTSYKVKAFIIHEIARINSKFAIEVLDSLLRSSNTIPRRHWELDYLAQAHANLGQYAESVFYLTEGIQEELNIIYHKRHPKYMESLSRKYYWRAVYKEKLRDYYGALADYNKLLCGSKLVHPFLDEIYLRKARCLIKVKKYCSAMYYLNRTLSITRHNHVKAEAYYYKGQCKHILNRKNGACMNWSKAGELGVPEAYEMIKKFCQ
jgi:tetratricopeptide (TPR) repeat protein